MKNNLACFGHTIDPYYLNTNNFNLIILIPKNSTRLNNLYKDFYKVDFIFKSNQLIEEFSDYELLNNQHLQKALRDHKITHFLISHRSDYKLFQVLKKLNISPIGNHYKISNLLEDKIYFDNLLYKLKIPKPKTLLKTFRKVVLQEANSFGSFGTKIHSTPVLIREFIDGKVYGITCIIYKNSLCISAIRQQCYYKNTDQLIFAGIQWIPTSYFSKKVILGIELSIKKIANFLKKSFQGILHFDFIINNNQVYFLECNPRPSSANPQLLSHSNDLIGTDFSSALLGDFSKLKSKAFINKSKYEGALLDLVKLDNDLNKKTTSCKNTDKIRLFSSTNNFKDYPKETFLGTVISNTPLFTKNGYLNKKAHSLYSTILNS